MACVNSNVEPTAGVLDQTGDPEINKRSSCIDAGNMRRKVDMAMSKGELRRDIFSGSELVISLLQVRRGDPARGSLRYLGVSAAKTVL
jgi:hypothetical protein